METVLQVLTVCLLLQINSAFPTDTPQPNSNATISSLITKQTETVKRIISEQKQSQPEYPVITKKTTDQEPLTEDMITKCKQLIFKPPKPTSEPTTIEPVTKKSRGPLIKPIESRISSPIVDSDVKEVKFEPVILQKNVMKDGQVYYYWHKSLPLPDYLSMVKPNATRSVAPPPYLFPDFPTTTTTTTTTPKPNVEPYYVNQLRFVVPVTYAPAVDEEGSRFQQEYDPYPYYTRNVAPQKVDASYGTGYGSGYPMLQTLVIPNRYVAENGQK